MWLLTGQLARLAQQQQIMLLLSQIKMVEQVLTNPCMADKSIFI